MNTATLTQTATANHATTREAGEALIALRGFLSPGQRHVIWGYCHRDEGEWFCDKLVELAGVVRDMPSTYEQDGKGDAAKAFLHYFMGSVDIYVTEKDADLDGEGQVQAFGWSDLGYGGELGYISLPEILSAGVELDLHFDGLTVGELKARERGQG